MQLVDVGQHAQLAHVDDLGDAGRRDAFALAREICTTTPSSGERTRACSRLRRALSSCGHAGWRCRSRTGPRSVFSVSFCKLQLDLLALEALLGEAGFELLHVGRLARPRASGESCSLSNSIDDFRVASSKAMSVTRVPISTVSCDLLQLGQLGLGHAHRHVGLGIVRQHGDDLVVLDLLAVLDAQLEQVGATAGIAGNDRRPGRARRYSRARSAAAGRRPGAVLGTAGLPAGRYPQDKGGDDGHDRHSRRTPREFLCLGHREFYQKFLRSVQYRVRTPSLEGRYPWPRR